MIDKRFVVEHGDGPYRRVGPAPTSEPGDFLTKAEAAARIVTEMDELIKVAKDSRRRAARILASEKKKGAR